MTALVVIGLIVLAYYVGRSNGYAAGSKKAQQYTLEIKKKD